jgi:eukaryotic-like serine/threonine-protein kinase
VLFVEDRLETLSAAELDIYCQLTDGFESAWLAQPALPPEPGAWLPDPPGEPLSGLVLLGNLEVDLESRSAAGTLPSPEQLLARYPSLSADRDGKVELLAWGSRLEDMSMRAQASGFDLPSLADRFPDLKDDLVNCRGMLSRDLDGRFPKEYLPREYILTQELNHAGMSRVAVVWNTKVSREEVIKLNNPAPANRPDAVKRFEQEIRLAAQLTEGQVVSLYTTGTLDGHLYYTMPYLRGRSLRERINAKSLPLHDVVVMLRDVARAVDALHNHTTDGQATPIVHRDLKPENILFPDPGFANPRIADLGLAKLLDAQAGPRAFRTATNEWLGTPGYMAPEQIRSSIGAVGPTADVFALGAILYELLAEQRPFARPTQYETILSTLHDVPTSPREIQPKRVPKDLSAVAIKALQKVPSQRYPSAKALADELDRWLEDKPVLAREPSAAARLWSTARRHPLESILASAFVVSLLVGFTVSTWFYFQVSREKAQVAHQKARADRNARREATVLNDLMERTEKGLARAGLTVLREDIFNTTADALDDLVRENEEIGSLELGRTLNQQAHVRLLLGRPKEGLQSSERAHAVFVALPPSRESQTGAAASLVQSGRLLQALGRLDDGQERTKTAIALFRPLVAEQPDDLDTRFRLARAENNLGNFLAAKNRPDGIAQYKVALEQFNILRRLSDDAPAYAEWQARVQSNLGLLFSRLDRPREALAMQTEAAALARQVVAARPGDVEFLDMLATCENNLGEALEQLGKLAEAEKAFLAALVPYQDLAQRFPEETESHWGLAMVQTSLGNLCIRRERWREAEAILLKAGHGFQLLEAHLGTNPEFRAHVESQQNLLKTARENLAQTR